MLQNLIWGEAQTCEYELRWWQRIGWDNRSLWMSGLFARDSGQNGFGQGKVDWLWVEWGGGWGCRLWRLCSGQIKVCSVTEGSGCISGSYCGRGSVRYYGWRWDAWDRLGDCSNCRNTSTLERLWGWWERRSWRWQEWWDGGGHLLWEKRHVGLWVGWANSITVVLAGD